MSQGNGHTIILHKEETVMPRKKKTEEAVVVDQETGEDILEKIERESEAEEKKNKSKKTKKNEPEKVVPAPVFDGSTPAPPPNTSP